MRSRAGVDKVRASRDGHEYHEAWTARKALQLLWPDSELVGISVEGLSPVDQASASAQTIEIADIALYYGHRPVFDQASRKTIVQFKYSVADRDEDFRASDAKKTIEKFGKTYREYKRKYGAQVVQDKLGFQLITNQPIYEPLLQAVEAIAKDLPLTGEVQKQARQFKKAAGLDGKPLATFAAKCRLIGRFGSLRATKDELENLLVDWSATKDPIAAACLVQLQGTSLGIAIPSPLWGEGEGEGNRMRFQPPSPPSSLPPAGEEVNRIPKEVGCFCTRAASRHLIGNSNSLAPLGRGRG